MKIDEVVKKPVPAERNPVATFAQRSGAGVHKDQNKKNTPPRKEKHKKKASMEETATAGATSAGSIASVANPTAANAKIKRDKSGVPIAPQKKNKDGTAKNALDLSNNLMGGKPIKR
jgi:hypothetical protein